MSLGMRMRGGGGCLPSGAGSARADRPPRRRGFPRGPGALPISGAEAGDRIGPAAAGGGETGRLSGRRLV